MILVFSASLLPPCWGDHASLLAIFLVIGFRFNVGDFHMYRVLFSVPLHPQQGFPPISADEIL